MAGDGEVEIREGVGTNEVDEVDEVDEIEEIEDDCESEERGTILLRSRTR